MTDTMQHGIPRLRRRTASVALSLVAVFALVVGIKRAAAQTFEMSYAFRGLTDGGAPYGSVIRDKVGNVYGTTTKDGVFGYGTVFKVDQNGKETVLYSFTGTGGDGELPTAALVRDAAGNLYGTTEKGGAFGSGTVFKLTMAGQETVLYSFTGGTDGDLPSVGLVRDSAGNLYGTTLLGGTHGYGVVFKVNTTGKEIVLHSFDGGIHGAFPNGLLVRDSAADLYGTTIEGGTSRYGTVFKLNKIGQETVLYSFTGKSDGGYPYAGVVRDAAGILYGTTWQGGGSNVGTVFQLDVTGKETVLHSFAGTDGENPYAGLVRDAAGDL